MLFCQNTNYIFENATFFGLQKVLFTECHNDDDEEEIGDGQGWVLREMGDISVELREYSIDDTGDTHEDTPEGVLLRSLDGRDEKDMKRLLRFTLHPLL